MVDTHLKLLIIWFIRRSNNLMVSSLTQLIKYLQSLDKSNDVIFPCSTMSLAEQSVLVSQKRIFLSKCPLIIVEPDPSVVTRSLQLLPANLVSVQARLRRSQILRVRSWLPVTIFVASPTNLAAITLPLWPVNVCCNDKEKFQFYFSLKVTFQFRMFRLSYTSLYIKFHSYGWVSV